MATQAGFTVGRDVGLFGRWFRFIVGIYFTLLLTAVPLIQDPIPFSQALSFLGELALYFVLILAVYLVAFYLLGERVLARASPWIGTLIFLGPLAVITALQLGPPTFRVALGVYINISLVLNFTMSYGGCEVIAIPSLIFRRRYTVYCPYNAVDAIESALVASPPGQQILAIVAIIITLLVGSYYILLDLMDLDEVLNVESDPRWALLFLFPIAFLVSNAVRAYQHSDGKITSAVTNYAAGALVAAVITVITFFKLDWQPFWVLFMIVGGLYALFRLVRSDKRQRQIAVHDQSGRSNQLSR